MKELLNKYAALEKQILDWFGFTPEWHVYPISNETNSHWMIFRNKVAYSPEPYTPDSIEKGAGLYTAEVIRPPLSANGFTALVVNTQCDGNYFLMIFDNSKECTDPALKELCEECW